MGAAYKGRHLSHSDVPVSIECEDCGVHLMAFETLGKKPVGRDDCPRCGCDEFTFVGLERSDE